MDLTKEIEIVGQGKYVVVDPLYLDQIRDTVENTREVCEGLDLLYQLENEAFPYSGGFILGYLNIENENVKINVSEFKKIKPEFLENPQDKERYCLFTSDSGVVMICEIKRLLRLSEILDFDLLFDDKGVVEEYLGNVRRQLSEYNIWALSTPGINQNVEFDGSGVYIYRP